jgi:hypothetical protein
MVHGEWSRLLMARISSQTHLSPSNRDSIVGPSEDLTGSRRQMAEAPSGCDVPPTTRQSRYIRLEIDAEASRRAGPGYRPSVRAGV